MRSPAEVRDLGLLGALATNLTNHAGWKAAAAPSLRPMGERCLISLPAGATRNSPNLPDVELLIIPTWDWTMNILPLASVDESRRIAHTSIPGTKDVNGHNLVTDNHIHHTGRLYWHGAAIFVTQSGNNHIAHNLIHNTPYNGLLISGIRSISRDVLRDSAHTIRWHEVDRERDFPETLPYLHAKDNLVEYNEIHDCRERLGDGNAIYISGAGEGNLIRRNYVHHILGPFTAAAMRTDGCQLGTIMTENIVYKCANTGIKAKYNNTYTNNITVDIISAENPTRNETRVLGYVGIGGNKGMIPSGAKLQPKLCRIAAPKGWQIRGDTVGYLALIRFKAIQAARRTSQSSSRSSSVRAGIAA